MNLSPAATTAAGVAAREQYLAALRRVEEDTATVPAYAALTGMVPIAVIGLLIIARRSLIFGIRQEVEA